MSSRMQSFAALLVLCSILVAARPGTAAAEDGHDKLKFGFSVAARTLVGNTSQLFSPTISPLDSTLRLDAFDRGAAVLSVTGVIFPWYSGDCCPSSRWGFAVHANIATLDAVSQSQTFNKSIEGGLGLAYRLSERSALSVSWEKVRYRVPREYVRAYQGRQMLVGGEPVLDLRADDERYFRTDDMDAISIRLLWFAD